MGNIFNTGLQSAIAGWLGITTDVGAWVLFYALLAIAGIAGYLLGSINSAVLISRLFYGDDIRNHGSGNAGTTNMLRTFGKGAAVCTLLGDILKSVLAILLAWILLGANWVGAGFSIGYGCYLAAMTCVLGHIYPIYHGFRGGKGVLCAATVIAMLSPWVFVILLVVFVSIVAITKYVSLGSCFAAGLYPLFLSTLMRALFEGLPPMMHMMATAITIGGLIIIHHRENIGRLRRGEEHKLSFKKQDKPTDEA